MESPDYRTERDLGKSGIVRSPDEPPSAAGAGLGSACAAIYAQHAGFVWRVLRSMGIARPQIEDAVQDVFIVVHRRYPQFDHRSKLQTWLYEICYRVAHAHRRKQKSAGALAVVDDELRATTPSPAERAEENERARLLFRLLSKLDEDKRMVLLLVEVEGMSAPEVADTLRLPLNTVYSRLRRARSEFSAAFEADARRQR